ncbi:MAG: hypothetical protein ACK5LJ_11835 [Paracoccus sp. (in: a-proteobacteria)]
MTTDVTHFVIFHPEDLAHAAGWPIAWYAEPFIYPGESAAGRLIGWSTGGDGSFALRLTDGPLTEREARYRGPEWVFPLSVRHGAVYLDGTDALPGIDQMCRAGENPDARIDLENGDYAVTVAAIEWDAEPGSEDDSFDSLPNYVVQFAPRRGAIIPAALRPPSLPCSMSENASDEIYTYSSRQADPADYDRIYPAFISANVSRAGRSFSSQGEAPVEAAVAPDADRFALFEVPFVIAARLERGEPAVIAECSGTSEMQGRVRRYEFRALQLVRIAEIMGSFTGGAFVPPRMGGIFRRRPKPLADDALVALRIAPLAGPDGDGGLIGLAQLKMRVLEDLRGDGLLARKLGGIAGYEARRLESLQNPSQIEEWLIDNLPMPALARLRIAALPILARTGDLNAIYNGMVADMPDPGA